MYGYSMDQYNFDNSLCQLLQDAEGASRTDIIGMNLL